MGRQGQVHIARSVRRPKLDALLGGGASVHGDAHGGAPVPHREEQIDGRFIARHQPPEGVGTGVGEGQQRGSVVQQAADVVQRHWTQSGIPFGVVEKGYTIPHQHLVEMHPIACLAKEGFGHKGHRLIVAGRRHLGHILDLHGGIGTLQQAHQRRLDLHLSRTAHLVMVILDGHAHGFQVQAHLAAQIVEGIPRWVGMVPTVHGNVVAQAAGGSIPDPFG